jgi:hypothetical protein
MGTGKSITFFYSVPVNTQEPKSKRTTVFLLSLLKKLRCSFWRAIECVGHIFAYVAHFVFLRYVWIRTPRVAVASRRTINFVTYLPAQIHISL